MKNLTLLATLLCLSACQVVKPVKKAAADYVVDPVKNASDKVVTTVGAGAIATSVASKNVAQKSAIVTRLPGDWYATDVSAESLRRRMALGDKAGWYYMGTRNDHHYLAKEFIDRKIFRVKASDFKVDETFKLTVRKSQWRLLHRRGLRPLPE